jgi:uncharacterized protein (TIGR02271 family)
MHDPTMTLDRLTGDLHGATVFDSAGEKIGKVEEVFYDDQTDRPEWLGIGTGFFGTKRVLVPVEGATANDDGVMVPYEKDLVKDAPDIDGDEIDEQDELGLFEYYGLQPRSQSGRAAGVSGEDRDRERGPQDVDQQSMTRSEEQLRVGTEQTESGSVRLRKWVETEPVQANVELERETVHVHREAVDQPVSGAEIGEQEIEMTLHEERPVVQKDVVARERVSLDKDVDVRQETVEDEVRKERIAVDGDTDARDPRGDV